MGKDNNQKLKEMTQQQIDKLMNSKEFNDAAFYLGGIYQLLSVICLWWDEAEDNLKATGAYGFDFKHDFVSCMKMLNRFEVRLRRYVTDWETLCKEYEELEPMLRQFVFGEETPELRLKNLKKGIEEFLKRNS